MVTLSWHHHSGCCKMFNSKEHYYICLHDIKMYSTLHYDWEKRKVTDIVIAAVGTHTSFYPTEEDVGCCPQICLEDTVLCEQHHLTCGQHPHLLVSMWGYAVTFTLRIYVLYHQCNVANGCYDLPWIQAPLTYQQDKTSS